MCDLQRPEPVMVMRRPYSIHTSSGTFPRILIINWDRWAKKADGRSAVGQSHINDGTKRPWMTDVWCVSTKTRRKGIICWTLEHRTTVENIDNRYMHISLLLALHHVIYTYVLVHVFLFFLSYFMHFFRIKTPSQFMVNTSSTSLYTDCV